MDSIEFSVAEGVATVTLNRPEHKNAIDRSMTEAMASVVEQVRRDEAIRALVIGGAGGAFSAGGDIKAMLADRDNPEARRARMRFHHAWLKPLIELDKPVIAAVDGAAFGAGFGLALAADLIVASERAKFCMAFMKVGLVPDFAALYTLPRVVGLARAKEIMFSARVIDAAEAVALGIALEVVAPDALDARAAAIAHSLAGASSEAFALTKRALNGSQLNDLSTMLEIEYMGQGVAFSTDDHHAAIDAFLNKRAPAFRWPED
ncbi:enoyl-CoA hydratase-related protein [Salinisphaera sp. T31B1]|uniref:enoyl-CoA hydratase/isomerase family protein n=1 Tax=Salinisphaera sp. T31B1 TaxID=727963 RepID=UPI0033412CA3